MTKVVKSKSKKKVKKSTVLKESQEQKEAIRKGLWVAGVKIVDTILKGILHKNQGKDPLDEAIKECEDTLGDVVQSRKDKRTPETKK